MWLRSTGLISCAFIGFDYAVRFFPTLMGTPITAIFEGKRNRNTSLGDDMAK